MRGVGLLVVLIAVAIIFYMMFGGPGKSSYVRTELETKKKAETEINEISGKDAQGNLATDSLTYESTDKGIVVKTVQPGGAFDTKYGVKPGDVIVELGPQPVKGLVSSNSEAKDWMHDAFQRSFDIEVLRGTQKLSLPRDRNAKSLTATPTPGTTPPAPTAAAPEKPAEPSAAPVQRNNAKKSALDIVKQVETH